MSVGLPVPESRKQKFESRAVEGAYRRTPRNGICAYFGSAGRFHGCGDGCSKRRFGSVQSLLLCGLLLCAFTVQAELTAVLQPVEVSRFVYEPFTLRLEISAQANRPDIPVIAGCTVIGIVPIPGSKGFLIEMIAEEPGVLSMPPITVHAGEETASTAPLRLNVAAPRRAQKMQLAVEFSATNVVVDQPVRMTVTWNSEMPFTRCQELLFELPMLRNAAWDVYPLDPGVPEKQRIGVPINNERVIARNAQTENGYELSFRYWLVPRSEGVFHFRTSLNCALLEQASRHSAQYPSYFNNHFFAVPEKSDSFERIYLSEDMHTLTVQALPESGRTVRYSGIVGACKAHASIRPEAVVVGQPMLLTVTVDGLPFSDHVHNLPEATLDALGPEFQITREPMRMESVNQSKTFTYVVRSLRSGIAVVPALAFDVYDRAKQAYRTVRTVPLSIRVEPDGKKTIYRPAAAQEQDPMVAQRGIRNNRKESESKMYRLLEFLARLWWLFWVLPPFIWLGLRRWFCHRDRCRIDLPYARRARALRHFRRAVGYHEESAWRTYLADRLGLRSEAITLESVATELRKQNVDAELIQAVCSRFRQQDAAQYAPVGTPVNDVGSTRQLVRRIQKATGLLFLSMCLFPIQDSIAASSQESFEQAMELRMEQPDEAQPLFTEAALGFEVERRFLNAGNSWFFAGENGRALANYLAAESRRPFSRQIRESITFIRAQRSDKFAVPDSFFSQSIDIWTRFCRWSAELRFGVVTLMYLIGWVGFLVARFSGKTISRRIWIGYGGVVAVVVFSLVCSAFLPARGVVIQTTDAHLGPGYAYELAYETILHEAVEFEWLGENDGWVHARMTDGNEAWMRSVACARVR